MSDTLARVVRAISQRIRNDVGAVTSEYMSMTGIAVVIAAAVGAILLEKYVGWANILKLG